MFHSYKGDLRDWTPAAKAASTVDAAAATLYVSLPIGEKGKDRRLEVRKTQEEWIKEVGRW